MLIEQAEQVRTEEDLPNSGVSRSKTDDFPAEGPSDEALATSPKEPTVGTDTAFGPGRRVFPLWQLFGQGTLAQTIGLGGRLQA